MLAFGVLLHVLAIIPGAVALVVVVLIDCWKNEPREGRERIAWALAILLLNLVGAMFYLFVRRPQRILELGH